jgi:DNA-directed RNA polymerase specialized sigma24 family protein
MTHLSSDDFDRRLQQLAVEAQTHPLHSRQRQQVLDRLVKLIMQFGHITHPQRGLWTSDVYEDFYNEALQKTWLYIFHNIENYRLEHSVMAWVNNLMKHHFNAVVREYRNLRMIPTLSLDELEWRLSSDEDTLNDSKMLLQFLEEDPEHLFRTAHIRSRPDVTFQFLALARTVEDKSWDELSQSLGISPQTLCSFFNRQLRNFNPYFYKHLQQ